MEESQNILVPFFQFTTNTDWILFEIGNINNDCCDKLTLQGNL